VRDSGTVLDGKYQIIDRLGSGGMGEVYRVQHLHLHETRVVKILRPDLANDPQLAQRFLQEARIATQIKHPNIAILHDVSRLPDGSFYMVWEYVEGEDVAKMARSGPLNLSLAVELGIQSLRGLGAIHAAGVIHRDISPDNLMVGRDSAGKPQLKIIDLGLAKKVALPSGEDTESGVVLGKLRYCAPEQASPDAPVIDARADLYSLAAVLYEMVSGLSPFDSESAHGFVLRKLTEDPMPLDGRNPKVRVPVVLDQTLRRALDRDPGRRFQDAVGFLQALVRVRDVLRGASTLEMPVSTPARGVANPLNPQGPQMNPPIGSRMPAPARPAATATGRRELTAQDKAAILARIEKATKRSDEGMLRLEAAQQALDRGEFERARELLQQASEYVPQAQRLTDLETRLEELAGRRELAERVSQAERLFEQYVTQRKVTQATLALEALTELWPDNPRRPQYADRLRSLEGEMVRQRDLEEAVQRATEALLRADVSTARATAQVLKESGEFERSAWLEREIAAAQKQRETQRSETERREAFDRAVLHKRFEEAERELEGLTGLGTSKVSLDMMRSRLEDMRRASRREDDVGRHERQFREAIEKRDWASARDVARSLSERVPDSPVGSQLMTELGRREESHRRQLAIDQGVTQVEALIAQKNAADAELALKILLKLEPNNANRKRLEKQIETLWRA
jgi:tRNA A-37 threonylcarbamoyl transferase component Bud32